MTAYPALLKSCKDTDRRLVTLEMHSQGMEAVIEGCCDLCGPAQALRDETAPEAAHSWVVCLQCGLVYRYPRPTLRSIRDRFIERKDCKPERSTLTALELLALERYHLLRPWIPFAAERKGRALEVGCANGCFLRLLQGAGMVVKGIEPDPTRSKFGQDTYALEVQTSVAELFEPSVEPLDLVASFEVLHRVLNPHRVLANIAGSLRQGGLLFLETPCLDIPGGPDSAAVLGPEALQAFSRAWLFGLLDLLGLYVCDTGFRDSHLWLVARKEQGAARLDVPLVLDDPVARFHSLRIARLQPDANGMHSPLPAPHLPPRPEAWRAPGPAKPLPPVPQADTLASPSEGETRKHWLARQARRLAYKLRSERHDILPGLARKVLRHVGLSPEWEPRYRPPKARPRLAILTVAAPDVVDEPIYQACLRWAVEKSYGPVDWTEIRSVASARPTGGTAGDVSQPVQVVTGRMPSGAGASDAPEALAELVHAAISSGAVVAFGVGQDGPTVQGELLESLPTGGSGPNMRLAATWHRPESVPGFRRIPIRIRRRWTWQPPLPAVCGICEPNGHADADPEGHTLLINIPMEQARSLLGGRLDAFLRSVAEAAHTLHERGWRIVVARHAPLDACFEPWLDGADVPYEVCCTPGADVFEVLGAYARALVVMGCRPLSPALGIGLGRASLGLDIGNGVRQMLSALGAGERCLTASDPEIATRIVGFAEEIAKAPHIALAEAAALRQAAWDATLANLARLLDVVEEAV